jgi:hypothetical protein
MTNTEKRRSNSDGASVEVVVKNGKPVIELIRGHRFAKETLTRDQAAAVLDDSWSSVLTVACEGDCWVCLLDDVVENMFR